nr:hypothetical protein [Thermoanaerobacterium sp. RBIITD]
MILKVPGKTSYAGDVLAWWLDYLLSPAPQAEPQAVGFSSGLSAAPQAAGASVAPQAAGASAGLSDAPQAEPQVEAASFLFHPNRLESAIVYYLHFWILRTLYLFAIIF